MATDKIAALYRILLLYEDVTRCDTSTTEADYIAYCNRIAVRFSAINQEIAETVEGLAIMGIRLPHHTVRSCVLHATNLMERQLGGDGNGV